MEEDYRSTALKNRPEPLDASFDIPLCRCVPHAGGGDCFFLCIQHATGDSVFSQRETLSQTTTEADLDRYRGLLRQSEEESESAEAEHSAIGHLAGMRLFRARSLVAEMEFCRSAIDVRSLREEVAKRSYWADAIAIESIQLSLNLKAVVLTRKPCGRYQITYDVLPDGVGSFEPIGFVVVWYGGSNYELMEGSGGQRLFQYAEIPGPIQDRVRGIGFCAAIASVPRNMEQIQQIAPNFPGPKAQIHTTPEAKRAALRRRNAKQANPAIMASRRPGSALPDVHSSGKMEIPCEHFGAIRWRGEAPRKSTRWSICRAKLPDIIAAH